MIKIIGSAIIILSLAVAFFGAVASINADKMAQLLSLAVEGFDKAEWKQHWLVSSAALAIAGCLGVFAGIGVLKNRKWGICLWACLLTALLIGQAIIVLSGYAMFSFEKMNPIETLIILIICIFSWAYYLKTKRQTTT